MMRISVVVLRYFSLNDDRSDQLAIVLLPCLLCGRLSPRDRASDGVCMTEGSISPAVLLDDIQVKILSFLAFQLKVLMY